MTTTQKTFDTATIKKLDKSRVEVVGSIPAEIWERFRSEAIKHINESVKIDGFRNGMVPESVLIAKVGERAILEEMAELALPKAYLDILIENKIDAIGRPEVHITKLAKGNALELKAITSVTPEVKLPDYKKIATDEIAVKKLGEFKDIPDFKNKLSMMVEEEKRDAAREKRRIRIADAIVEKATIDLPDVMIQSELDRSEAQFKADIERMGVKLEDYLKYAKKSLEEIRKEWQPSAEKKAKLQLILNEIAKAEKIAPEPKEVEEEVDRIVAVYKDADREHATAYAETVLTNEKVFQWLERV
ncbi:MAG: trigger factor [Candidatus Taylorbacteria bacterium]|nr:trigger factor [Candidatus Taylorbacteria bacterium]